MDWVQLRRLKELTKVAMFPVSRTAPENVPTENTTNQTEPASGCPQMPSRTVLKACPPEEGPVRLWYFDCDGHYIDVEKDDNGKISIFFHDRSDRTEGWFDQSELSATSSGEQPVADELLSNKTSTSNSDVLASCPFCGARAMFSGGGSCRTGKIPVRVECSSRLCLAATAQALTKEDAARIWNRRVHTSRTC